MVDLVNYILVIQINSRDDDEDVTDAFNSETNITNWGRSKFLSFKFAKQCFNWRQLLQNLLPVRHTLQRYGSTLQIVSSRGFILYDRGIKLAFSGNQI